MKKLSIIESSEIINKILVKLEKGLKKQKIQIEYFKLTLNDPIYEKLNCAYIQTNDLKEGVLYEAVTGRYFYLKISKDGTPSLDSLTKSVNSIFPKSVKDKMFWVCGNKKDKNLEIDDFRKENGASILLSK
jgi:hypothetical protein